MHHRNYRTAHSNSPITAKVFAELYDANFLLVKAFLTRKGCDRSSLDDLAQETFLRAWAARDRFSSKSSFRTWLLGIARNVRREHARQPLIVEPIDQDVSDEDCKCAYTDEIAAVKAAIANLPTKQRRAICLVYFEDLRPALAAKGAGCKLKVFHQRLYDARLRLALELREMID